MNEQERAESIIDLRAIQARRAVMGLDPSNEEDREVLRIIIEMEEEEQERSMVLDAAKDALASETWAAALLVECPNCGAKAGDSCTNYRGANMGEPHSVRKKAAGDTEGRRARRREWPQCTAKGCEKNVYMPSGDWKLCYSHYVAACATDHGLVSERFVANLVKYGECEPPEGKRSAPVKKRKSVPKKDPKQDMAPREIYKPKPKARKLQRPRQNPGEKLCPKCNKLAKGEEEIDEQFGYRTTKSKRKDGTVVEKRVPQSYCRDCRRTKK